MVQMGAWLLMNTCVSSKRQQVLDCFDGTRTEWGIDVFVFEYQLVNSSYNSTSLCGLEGKGLLSA